ncbi:uncharacterized protein DUF2220 [Desulfobotulus alkaliphilus]|uniref:Uncharacterized protein DUF2220 n=1 Tax=Desulfobotulus alkaliphilus TaxID=622671 RepID=A0A562RY80_9BACT|nr:Wadjet anti-phage system protein JetD domain-containing protein [Desulfobotulus alkaliphilus]TWI74011.1 uncharacterized protein DUF2220 [Desulfobotulus alkaliphilus]
MGDILQEAVLKEIQSSKVKRIKTRPLLDVIKKESLSPIGDFDLPKRLLEILQALEKEKRLQMPKGKKAFDKISKLPDYITALKPEEDAAMEQKKSNLYNLRNLTAWEPRHMIAFAPRLKKETELELAKKINHYLLNRKSDAKKIPHRERALQIFGDEKALDGHTRKGLFGGRITLEDLDCFYCPEPLPFQSPSPDKALLSGKPLLVVENANTYWSCCQANGTLSTFAAVVYGKGFRIAVNESANDGLEQIRADLKASEILYFGDLDPTGIAIPVGINATREKNNLPPLRPALSLYKALLEKNLTTAYDGSQSKHHNPMDARQWLGDELAGIYLEKTENLRWPQEGLTAEDIHKALT